MFSGFNSTTIWSLSWSGLCKLVNMSLAMCYMFNYSTFLLVNSETGQAFVTSFKTVGV